MTITLEEIAEEHAKVAEMIKAFKAQSAKVEFHFPEALIELVPGEEYAGLIVGKDGAPSYHLILLPGEAEKINWQSAKTWAKDAGGELPTRREQSLLFANLKEQFKEAYYWSGEQHASGSDYAWTQNFYDGYQGHDVTSLECRARAVRRLEIQ